MTGAAVLQNLQAVPAPVLTLMCMAAAAWGHCVVGKTDLCSGAHLLLMLLAGQTASCGLEM
jgi:hypothetical protein